MGPVRAQAPCAVVGWLLVLVFGFRGQREAAKRNAKGVGPSSHTIPRLGLCSALLTP